MLLVWTFEGNNYCVMELTLHGLMLESIDSIVIKSVLVINIINSAWQKSGDWSTDFVMFT